MNLTSTRHWHIPLILAALFSGGLALADDDGDENESYGVHSLRGHYAFSMDGSFSSAPPPFMGDRESFRFSQLGLYYFDGHGGVSGEFSLAFENETSGGNYSKAIEIGTYTVATDGRMLIEFQDYRGDRLINEATLDCVIVKRRKLARCIMVRLISYQQGPQPVPLSVTGLGAFKRQR